jgi:3-oxoadipate enol-lactonase
MPALLGIEGIRVHRTGTGPAVVLLHCLGVDHRLWDAPVARLKDRFTFIRYDFPGHGESPVAPGRYLVDDLSAQLDALLTREGVEQAHLVGISLGGLVAQHFAANAPQSVVRLVLADTTPRYTDDMRRMWAQRAAGARTLGVRSLTEGVLKIWFTEEMVAANPPAVQYVKDSFARMAGEGYALACEALAAADLRPLASQIVAPTLLICGDEDVPSFLDSAKWLAANIRSARLEWLKPARHASVLEQPDAFARLLQEFLA